MYNTQVNSYKNITHLVFAISSRDFYCLPQCIPNFNEKVEQELSWTFSDLIEIILSASSYILRQKALHKVGIKTSST